MRELWVEKYRPKTLDEYIFPNKDIEKLCRSFIEDRNIPNLLLSGIQGSGKTTLARILINELDIKKTDVKRINASSERGIANIRDNIESFCRTAGMSAFRIVLLEEADGLTPDAQKALRVLTEDHSERIRFIMTCNYPSKIIPALHSRFQHIQITELDMERILERILEILDKENIQVDDQELILDHVSAFYPDMRKIINSLDQSSRTGSLQGVLSISHGDSDIEEWKSAWAKPDLKTLIDIAKNMTLDNMDEIYRVMYENIENLPEEKRNTALIAIAEYLYRTSFVSDQEINLVACLLEIFDE